MTEPSGADLEVVVQRRTPVADGIVELILGTPGGSLLPPWTPGAHIDVVLDTAVRQYSLCGDPADRLHYRIAVRREEDGRGGSRRIHDEIRTGDTVVIRGPRNHFALEPSPAYVFIAGGIGITPLLPMLRQAEAQGSEWRLYYGGRRSATMAYCDEVAAYGGRRVTVSTSATAGRMDLDAALRHASPDSIVYCCGPATLLEASRVAAMERGMRCRTEHFAPKEIADAVDAPFTVRLESTGTSLTVPAERSLLDVLIDADADVFSSCEEGTCGTCEVPVLEGVPDHRDSVLTPEEQAAGDRMMACVSRALSATIVLDI